MKISHECPLSMLGESLNFNDYDYALVHLFEEHPKYYQFFKDSLKGGRTVYLDNSVFELGEAFDPSTFAEYCRVLGAINPQNFYYIVPDKLRDAEVTIKNFNVFSTMGIPGKSIGVAQGKTKEEVIECFQYMKENADMVALCFNYPFYGNTPSEWCHGRVDLVHEMYRKGLMKGVEVHLLGCSLPQEFSHYRIPELVSVDTSNPVVHGIKGIRYNNGLGVKDSEKLVDLLMTTPDKKQLEDIFFNIKSFRELVGAK